MFPNIAAYAFETSIESYISTESWKFEYKGVFPGGQFGSSLGHADINGDGLVDIFIGSPFTSVFKREWNGSIAIVFGSKTDSEYKIHIYGENSGDQFGTSISSGDYNNDGKDDLVVGAYNAGLDDTRTGLVYIIYGNMDMGSQMDMTANTQKSDFVLNKTNAVIGGHEEKGQFGVSMLTIDVNKDGFDDLVVGEPGATMYGNKMAGAVYVYLGGINGINSNYSYFLYGHNQNEKFGSSITGGDYDNDGKIDLVIGAYMADVADIGQAGRVYYYHDIVDTALDNAYNFLDGNNQKSWFGFATDSGDANGDGIDDLLVSSFPYKSNKDNTGVFLYYGGDQFMVNGKADVVIYDPYNEALPGASVLLSDLNGDFKSDIIIGAPGVSYMRSTDPGDVYIIFSSENPYKGVYSIREKTGINVIHGEKSDDWFGYGMKSFDFNNDNMMDLAISSRYSDTISGVNNGKVFVLQGKNRPFGRVVSLRETKGIEVTRADLVKIIFESFDLRTKNANFLQSCYAYKEFCLFNFMAMSSFNDIQLNPNLILFPDVPPENEYYNDINDATILGLVNGYLDEINSPFHPELPVTRIQALKVILGAADLVPQKYKFELIAMFGSYANLISQSSYFYDIDAKISEMWWYPRYINFAVENGIISDGDFFRPNDNITVDELNDFIINTLPLLKSEDEKD